MLKRLLPATAALLALSLLAAVLLFLLTNLVLTLPYALWRQRRAHPAGHTDGNTT